LTSQTPVGDEWQIELFPASPFPFYFAFLQFRFDGTIDWGQLAGGSGSLCSRGLCGTSFSGFIQGAGPDQPALLHGIPEPSTWAMMLIGFAGLGFALRQSRRRVSLA
jgi:hypothetical protein